MQSLSQRLKIVKVSSISSTLPKFLRTKMKLMKIPYVISAKVLVLSLQNCTFVFALIHACNVFNRLKNSRIKWSKIMILGELTKFIFYEVIHMNLKFH